MVGMSFLSCECYVNMKEIMRWVVQPALNLALMIMKGEQKERKKKSRSDTLGDLLQETASKDQLRKKDNSRKQQKQKQKIIST